MASYEDRDSFDSDDHNQQSRYENNSIPLTNFKCVPTAVTVLFLCLFESDVWLYRYIAQLKSCEMRYTILKNEMEEISLEEELMNKKIKKIREGLLDYLFNLCLNGAIDRKWH